MAKRTPPTTGQFRKGDGRRRGPPPMPEELREAFRAASRPALVTLLTVLERFEAKDESIPASAAVSAAVAILDRGLGKPPAAPEDREALKEVGPVTTREAVMEAFASLRKPQGAGQ